MQQFSSSTYRTSLFRLSALLLGGLLFPTDASAQAVPPFAKTLLQQQQQAQQRTAGQTPPATRQPAGPPAPIPFSAVVPLETDVPARDWKHIVLHHSATLQGSLASIHREHSQRVDAQGKPWRGIAYHFVIGNGQGMRDGEVQATFRWDEQTEGAHAGDLEYNQQGIGICLIGNFDETSPTAAQLLSVQTLVSRLQKQFRIPTEQVVAHRSVKATSCPGKYFPMQQMVTALSPAESAAEVKTAEKPTPLVPPKKLIREDAPLPADTLTR